MVRTRTSTTAIEYIQHAPVIINIAASMIGAIEGLLPIRIVAP